MAVVVHPVAQVRFTGHLSFAVAVENSSELMGRWFSNRVLRRLVMATGHKGSVPSGAAPFAGPKFEVISRGVGFEAATDLLDHRRGTLVFGGDYYIGDLSIEGITLRQELAQAE